jgi:hypothetical protein
MTFLQEKNERKPIKNGMDSNFLKKRNRPDQPTKLKADFQQHLTRIERPWAMDFWSIYSSQIRIDDTEKSE